MTNQPFLDLVQINRGGRFGIVPHFNQFSQIVIQVQNLLVGDVAGSDVPQDQFLQSSRSLDHASWTHHGSDTRPNAAEIRWVFVHDQLGNLIPQNVRLVDGLADDNGFEQSE
ncbi:hypothetical protein WICPIJ_000476 [Wickerhamomyces pijperi]|uniref:Uncharacterized protein n=1 Tax=Wickerhamomyces pijperi TaxID=599730 RepID=A0A9P8QGK4_WICPI|nr:hypothetical protein WICPIJ_000476 [Wickerhamomyces pijperi]